MILPITAYGMPVLRRMAQEVSPDHPDLDELIANMWETMYNANGVGLAAPQIGQSLRLFLVDSVQLEDDEDDTDEDSDTPPGGGIKQVFLNAEILERGGEPWDYEEGCLSIPDLRADVKRPDRIVIRYQDEHFKQHEKTFDGLNGRVIQHEYDHIEGTLFTDHLSPLKQRMLKKKLENIRRGRVDVRYKMRFAQR